MYQMQAESASAFLCELMVREYSNKSLLEGNLPTYTVSVVES